MPIFLYPVHIGWCVAVFIRWFLCLDFVSSAFISSYLFYFSPAFVFRCCFLINISYIFFLVSSAFRWQLNKQRADEQQQSCVRGKAVRFVLSFIWLFDVWWFFSLYFIHFFPRVYLFCTCKIQKCHLDFSLWNRFSMFNFFFLLLFLISNVRVCLCCLSIVLSLEDFYQFLL